MSPDDFLVAIRDKLPPACRSELAKFEQHLGVELPADYAQFLIRCNGGHVGGDLWFDGINPNGEKVDAGVHHVGGFRDERCFSLILAQQVYQSHEIRIPYDLLWIMDDPFGNAICLGLRGRYRGKVFFWVHEREPYPDEWDGGVETAGNVQLIANSFSDFMAGLRPTLEVLDRT